MSRPSKQFSSPMNDKQKKMAEENHDLIYKVIADMNLDREEYYDIGAIGLCYATFGYKKNKGTKFSTYAYTCIQRHILNEIRTKKSEYKIKDYQLFYYQGGDEHEDWTGNNIVLQLPSNDNTEKSALIRMGFKKVYNKLSDRDKTILQYYIKGYAIYEIGDIIGLTRQHTSVLYLRIKDKIERACCY